MKKKTEKKIVERRGSGKAVDSLKASDEENILHTYLKEIDRIPLLSKKEEEKLAKQAVAGNIMARDRLVSSNLRFVVTIAKKFQGNGLSLEDLVSEGNIGLIKAASHFDADKGYRFITYAVWWIRQVIIRAIHEKGRIIRLPSNKSTEVTKIKKTRQILQNEPGWRSDDGIRDIALFLEMTEEKADNLMKISQEVRSLDDPVSMQENAITFKDCIEDGDSMTPDEYAMNSVMKDELDKILNGLKKRDAEIIRCRYGLCGAHALSLKEIGARYNISRERVRQIENHAMRQLQRSNGFQRMQYYIA